MTIGIVVATFGNEAWYHRGLQVATDLYGKCVPDDIIHVHDETLAKARNLGADMLKVDHLIFVDADDDLDSDYVARMQDSVQKNGTLNLFQPSTLGVYPDGLTDDFPTLIPKSGNILRRNYLVIGTMCPREAFLEVGGFRELPALEDHDLWLRLILYGCGVVTVPSAVYRILVRPDSRNKDKKAHAEAYRRIQRDYAAFSEIYHNYPFVGQF